MNYIEVATAALGIALTAGAVAAWYKRSEGKNLLELAESTISMYKNREAEYLRQISELTAQVTASDKTIAELRNTIKIMVKEFKAYKNDSRH